jgi:hypothetical protein
MDPRHCGAVLLSIVLLIVRQRGGIRSPSWNAVSSGFREICPRRSGSAEDELGHVIAFQPDGVAHRAEEQGAFGRAELLVASPTRS